MVAFTVQGMTNWTMRQLDWISSKEKHECAVVFGTYNRAHLLKQSRAAYVEAASKNKFCLVAINDGSTDDTRALLLEDRRAQAF